MDPQQKTQFPPTNPPLPPPKPRLPLLLAGLFVSVLILGGSYFIFGTKKPESLTPPVSQTPLTAVPIIDPTVNWKTYISQAFSIKYPSHWHLSENKWENQKYVVLSDNPDASANTFTIDIYENSQMDQTTDYILHYYVNSTAGLADRHPKEISKTRVNIAEVEADKYIYKLDEQQEFPYTESTVIIFQYGQDSYVFKVSGKDQKILDQILSTFTFLDQGQTNPTLGVDETLNWETYTSNTYNYTVKYPPEWILFENDPRSVSFLTKLTQGESYGVRVIVYDNPGLLSAKEWWEKNIQQYANYNNLLNQTTREDKVINGNKVYFVLSSPEKGWYSRVFAHSIISKGNKIYQITSDFIEGEYYSNYNKILSTFKFTE